MERLKVEMDSPGMSEAQIAWLRRQEIQFRVSQILALSSSLEVAAREILMYLVHLWQWDCGVFWERNPKHGELVAAACWIPKHPTASTDMEPPIADVPEWHADLSDISAEARFDWMESALAKGFRSNFFFPILCGNAIQAQLGFFSCEPRPQESGFVEIAADLSSRIGPFLERLCMEAALKDNQEKLRESQKQDAIGRLAGGVAHDFNNLLTAINGYSELLLSKMPPSNSFRSHIEEIHKAGLRAALLTNQLLAFSRKQMLIPQVINLSTVATEMRSRLEDILGKEIHLEMRLATDLKPVKIDPAQMRQVLVNLILNARDAMPTGGKLILETADVPASQFSGKTMQGLHTGEYVRVSIADTGRGMDEPTLCHLFEPFFTTKEPGKGPGLGLSTVEGIIRQSGGVITVHSEIGYGATFNLFLPVYKHVNSRDIIQKDAVEVPSARRETILLVEDEEAVRRLVLEILVSQGYEVLEAQGGPEALRIEREHPDRIDLLLTDLIMPGMHGREVSEAIKIRRPDIHVLFMSGYTEDAITRHGVESSDYAFLQKPFSPSALVEKVGRCLGFQKPYSERN